MSRVKAGTTTRFRHKKILKRAKDTSAEEKILLKLQIKLWRRLVNMPIEIERLKKTI